MDKKRITSTNRKGFAMTFANGITASVQWGAGNYCDNQFSMDMSLMLCNKDVTSDTAEVAAIDSKGRYVTPTVVPDMCGCDDVIGFLSPEDIVDFLLACRDYKTE